LHFFLGGCYLDKEDYAKAIPELRKTVELDPAFTHAQINFGRALLKNHQYEEAATAFERAEKTEPNLMDVHVFLEVIYAQLNRVPDELRECRIVLEVVPDHFGSNLNLGRFLAKSGDLQGAIAPLEKAASIRPKGPMPHRYLADVYTRMGRVDDAKRETDEADRLAMAAPAPASSKPDDVELPEKK
jgi:tetratricopeptide (TPR) repeat protein